MKRSVYFQLFFVIAAVVFTTCRNPVVTYVLSELYEHTVTFDKNGGNTEPSPKTIIVKNPSVNVRRLPEEPTRVDHIFTGWNTLEDGHGVAFDAASSVNSSFIVYAQWRTVPVYSTYIVTFDKNHNDNTGWENASPISKTVNNAAIDSLPLEPTREGYVFIAWNTKSDGSGTVFTTSTIVSADLNVYAQWYAITPGSFIVRFNNNGGDTQAVPQSKIVMFPAIRINDLPQPPERTGYFFAGWNTKEDGSGVVFDAKTNVTESLTVFAQWEGYSYAVIFDKNGGDILADPETINVVSPMTTVGTLPAAPERYGYGFAGWNTMDDGKGINFTRATPVTGNITVYAIWIQDIIITFNKNGGDTDANPITGTIRHPATTIGTLPSEPKRNGYAFTGWNTKLDGSGTAVNTATIFYEDIILFAQWQFIPPNSFTVTFDKNGGDTEAYPLTKLVVYPATTIDTLPIPPKLEAHFFIGWHTPDGEVFTKETIVTSNITVKAQWQSVPIGSLTLYKNNMEVFEVKSFSDLIPWLRVSGNVMSNTEFRAVLHNNAVLNSGLALTGSESAVILALETDGKPYQVKMETKGLFEIGAGYLLRIGDGITLLGCNQTEDGEDNDNVLIYINGGTFEMYPGSEISGNVNRKSSGNALGGAVYIRDGSFNMKGGVIRGNQAIAVEAGKSSCGAGVYMENGFFYMEGAANIDAANEVYLCDGAIINLNGILSGSACAQLRLQSYTDGKQVLGGSIAANYTKFKVSPNEIEGWTIDSAGKLVIPRFSVSGRITLSGGSGSVNAVSVQLKQNGDNIGSPVNPNSSGSFTIPNVPAGNNYTISVSLTNYHTETSLSFDVRDNVNDKNLTLSAVVYAVSGKIILSGGSGSVTAVSVQLKQNGDNVGSPVNPNASGDYNIADVAVGSNYTVTAALTGYNSASSPAFNLNGNVSQNLELSVLLYTVSGRITITGGSSNVTSVSVQLRQNNVNVGSFVNPNASGDYTISNVPAGSNYFVYASLSNYETKYTTALSINGNVTGQNLNLLAMYSVSGTITLSGGSGRLNDVSLMIWKDGVQYGQPSDPDIYGNYNTGNIPIGNNYSIQAWLNGYGVEFTAPFNITNSNVTGRNLTLSAATVYVDTPYGIINAGYTTLKKALDSIISDGVSTVMLTTNQDLAPYTFSDARKHIIIKSYNPSTAVEVRLSSNGSLFTVGPGVNLTLGQGLTVRGRSANNASLITVSGVLNMENGVTITGNTYDTTLSGVSTRGGGININPDGQFNMNGGTISGNRANEGGGVYSDGTIWMMNGTISGNTGITTTGGVGSPFGGGVFISFDGNFIMERGTISTNTAEYGGGVFSSGIFNFQGGTISGNTALCGGGVLNNGTFNMQGGTISGNTADDGGGVLSRDTFNMQDGTISGNTARYYGGGVEIILGSFTKNRGIIYGYTAGDSNSNTVKNSSGVVLNNLGHAVLVYLTDKSTISKRKETSAGSSVYLYWSYNGGSPTWSGSWDY